MNNSITENKNKVRILCITGLLVAISLLLANVKLFSTVALDSLPAFLGAIMISPIMGGVIGALGHFFTALTSGFPLTLPMHIVVMVEMLVIVYIFGKVYKGGYEKLSIVVAVILNGPVATFIGAVASKLIVNAMPIKEFFLMMVIPLTIATVVNVALAYILGKVLKNANIKI